MADENLYSLLIRVEGGDVAAAEIIKQKYALKSVSDEATVLKERFQEGFQHVALRGFLADSARAIGLGTELRPVISLLNVGVTQLAGAFGLMGGPLGVVTTGLAALVGLAVVVHNHFAKHAEDLAATYKGYQDNVQAIDGYVAAGGKLSANLQQLRRDYEELARQTLEAVKQQNAKKLADDQLLLSESMLRDAATQTGAAFHSFGGDMVAASEETKRHKQAVDEDREALEANAHGFATWKEYVASGTQALKDHAQAEQDAARASEQRRAAMQKAGAEIQAGLAKQGEEYKKVEEAEKGLAKITTDLEDESADATRTASQKKAAAIQRWYDDSLARIKDLYAKAAEAAHGDEFMEVEAASRRDAAIAALGQARATKERENYTETEAAFRQMGASIERQAERTAAHSIVESQNASQAAQQVGKAAAEEVIADLIHIGVVHTLAAAKRVATDQGAAAHAVAADAHATAAKTAALAQQTTAATASSTAQVAAQEAVTVAVVKTTGAVIALTAALHEATAAAIALDAAMVGV